MQYDTIRTLSILPVCRLFSAKIHLFILFTMNKCGKVLFGVRRGVGARAGGGFAKDHVSACKRHPFAC